MKAIINRKTYNTETATKIGNDLDNYDNGNWFSTQTLYRKKNGEYFRAIRFNGSNIWAGDDKIIPISFDEAAKWAEEYIGADDYIAEFGDPGEGGEGKERTTIYLFPAAKAKLNLLNRQTGKTISAIVDDLITNAN